MTWLYLALLAPFLYAVVNLLDDNLVRHVYKGAHAGAIVSGLFGLVPAALILLFGQGAVLPVSMVLLSLLAGFLTVIAFYFYFQGLEKEDPSVVVALLSLTPAATPFIAHYLVGERLSAGAVIGFTIVILSAFAYSITDIKKFTVSKALVPVIIAALTFDAASLANKYVYTKADFYESYLYFSLGMAMAGLFFLVLLRFSGTKVSLTEVYRKNSIKILSLLALVEVIGLSAEFVKAKALSLGSISLVQALENLQPFYVLLIAIVLFPFFPQYFREAQSGRRVIKFLLLVAMVTGAYIAVR